jgi:hypothetical protein
MFSEVRDELTTIFPLTNRGSVRVIAGNGTRI